MCFFLGFLMASYLVAGCVGSWFCLRCFWFLCRAFSSVWVLVFMSGFISRMCLLCRCLFGAGCRTEAGHGAPAGAGSCRTGRRPRSGACSSTVGDAAPVPGAPRDAHGSAPCAFGETGPMAVGSRAMDRMNRVRPPTCPYGPWTVARWTGTPSSGPVHGPGVVRDAVPAWAFAWTTYLVGPPNGPWSVRVVRDAGPHMGFRVGRMIGPACGPLVHSHDVVRKRAGHADGPHASTWPIRPPGPWSRTPAMAHTAWA